MHTFYSSTTISVSRVRFVGTEKCYVMLNTVQIIQISLIMCTYMCPSPVQAAASPLPHPGKDAWALAALWSLPLVSWWLWEPWASLWVLVLWVSQQVSEVLAFWWAQGLSASLLWPPSLLLSLPWLQRHGFKKRKTISYNVCLSIHI